MPPTETNLMRRGKQQKVMDSVLAELESASIGIGIRPFLCLPSPKDYPTYYEDIVQPISVAEIKKTLKDKMYPSVSSLIDDLKLMFSNCMTFNRSDSEIYKTAFAYSKLVEEISARHNLVKAKRSSRIDENVDHPDNNEVKQTQIRAIYESVISLKTTSSKQPAYKLIQQHIEEGVLGTNTRRTRQKSAEAAERQSMLTNVDFVKIGEKVERREYEAEQDILDDLCKVFDYVLTTCKAESEVGREVQALRRVALNATTAISTPLETSTSRRRRRPLKLGGDEITANSSIEPMQQQNTSAYLGPAGLAKLLKTIYAELMNKKDENGRLITRSFIELPSRELYPEYYSVIKRPMDMNRVHSKIIQSQYRNLNDFMADMCRMLTNACLYNESTSPIYREALSLQAETVSICNRVTGTPAAFDAAAAARHLFATVLRSTVDTTDSNGRFYADSIYDLFRDSESVIYETATPPIPSLQSLCALVTANQYARFDTVQEHFVRLMEHVRSVCDPDQQAYEDSLELQKAFLNSRDFILRKKMYTCAITTFPVPAFNDHYDEGKALVGAALRSVGKSRDFHEIPTGNQSGRLLAVGEYALLKSGEVVCLLARKPGSVLLGRVFVRPAMTTHSRHRRFLENEVFLTSTEREFAQSDVAARCFVMFYATYRHYKPQNRGQCFLCESIYDADRRAFAKIVEWESRSETLARRSSPISLPRSTVVAGDEDKILSSVDECIRAPSHYSKLPGQYELVTVAGQRFHVGSCVALAKPPPAGPEFEPCLLASPQDTIYVIQIYSLTDGCGGGGGFDATGPLFVSPNLTIHEPTRIFYTREVVKYGNDEFQIRLDQSCRSCFIIDSSKYAESRPTEFSENDIYVTGSRFSPKEGFKRAKYVMKVPKSGTPVAQDELIYIDQNFLPSYQPSPHLRRLLENPELDIDGFDLATTLASNTADTMQPPSSAIANNNNEAVLLAAPPAPTVSDIIPTPQPSHNNSPKVLVAAASAAAAADVTRSVASTARRVSKKPVCGYRLFSAKIRDQVKRENKGCDFGAQSKIIGEAWRALSSDQRSVYEMEARRINAEDRAAAAEEEKVVGKSSPKLQLGGGGGGADNTNLNSPRQYYQRAAAVAAPSSVTHIKTYVLQRILPPVFEYHHHHHKAAPDTRDENPSSPQPPEKPEVQSRPYVRDILNDGRRIYLDTLVEDSTTQTDNNDPAESSSPLNAHIRSRRPTSPPIFLGNEDFQSRESAINYLRYLSTTFPVAAAAAQPEVRKRCGTAFDESTDKKKTRM